MIRPTMRRAKSTGSSRAPTMLRRQTSDQGRRPVKKLVVSMKKKKTALPENFEEDTWAKLKVAVDAVHAQTSVSYSREELYHAVENLCMHKKSEGLFSRLQAACSAHIAGLVAGLEGQTPDVGAFLRQVQEAWEQHCNQMVIIRSIFLYLDRTHVIHTQHHSLWDVGLSLFCEQLAGREELMTKIVSGLLQLIENERNGEAISRSLLSALVRMFSQLKIYHEAFEGRFLETTTAFYRQEGQRYMQQSDVSHYLRRVQRRLSEEGDRVMAYLDHSTRRELIATVERELLASHSQTILDKGFSVLMDANKQDDLALLFRLMQRIDAVPALNEQFKAYVKVKGAELVSDPEKDKTMVASLLDLKKQIDVLHANAFMSNDDFKRSIKSAFEFFINTRHNKPAEMIAKFVDKHLKSSKGASEIEIEDMLNHVMELFRAINGKDVFEAFYKKDLAKRLLLGRSASVDLELSMLSKLKTECGSVFTSKLEGMFKDVNLSKELMTEYKDSPFYKEANLPFEAGVHVLTTTYWPAYDAVKLSLPASLENAQASFADFYNKKFTGRRLSWAHNLGHCVLRSFFPSGRKELAVSLFQACVLLMFNTVEADEEVPFETIQQHTGLDDDHLKLTLMSLACGRARVLVKVPKSKTVAKTDTFKFNSGFKAKMVRIKINSIQMKETAKEQKETETRVFKERLYQIDACIVRIMKSRKTLSHTGIMSELFAQLRFPAEPAQVKKRIESLLEREYLERDEETPSIYHYVA